MGFDELFQHKWIAQLDYDDMNNSEQLLKQSLKQAYNSSIDCLLL